MKTLFRLIPVFLFLAVLGCSVGDSVNFPSSNPIGPPPDNGSGRQTATGYSGQLMTAPSGTQIREDENESWVTATALEYIDQYNETRNTLSNDYEVDLYADAMMEYNDVFTVSLDNISGDVYYKASNGEWYAVTGTSEYYASAVATGGNGSVSITCSLKGAFPPPPPPDSLKKNE